MMANGNVSNSGALDEISPSLFRPLRRLKNDPVLSPTKQANPRKVPKTNTYHVKHETNNETLEDDLFPKDFMIKLALPETYKGQKF